MYLARVSNSTQVNSKHLTIQTVHHTVSKIGADVERIKSIMDEDEGREILNWLTPIDYGAQQSDFLKRRHEGTGTWLLQAKEFSTWLGQSNRTLYCSGIPGAGKTILASTVVDHLFSKFRADAGVGIAFIYCNFRQQQQQRPEDLLLSVLKQWLQKRPSVPEHVRTLYESHRRQRTRPSLTEILETLICVAALYSQTIVIVDALDECDDSDSNRQNFLSAILNTQEKTKTNLLVTSRINDTIAKFFETALCLEIRANEDDIKSYIDGQMSRLPSDILDEKLRDRIRREVVESIDGMYVHLSSQYCKLENYPNQCFRFLLAQLHMNNLKRQPTKGDMKQALQHLARGIDGLDKTYEQTMERINDQGSHVRDLAHRILGWIVHAKRPLSTAELRHALAVKLRTAKLDEDYLLSVQHIKSVCAGLVTADEESGIIRLVHYTTQEYFAQKRATWFPDTHADITKVCVTYLTFDVFGTGFCSSSKELDERLETHALYDYAAKYWGYHASNSRIENDIILEFLRSRAKSSAASQAMMASTSPFYHFESLPTQMIGVHIAAYLGLDWATKGLLAGEIDIDNANLDLGDGHGQTPLSWAARNGHEAVVKLLLDTRRVDVDSKDNQGRTPLSWAAKNGHEAVVKLLFDMGRADVDSKDNQGRTPLSWAAKNGHEAVVKLLLDMGRADVNLKDNYRHTPLSWAAENGHEAVVRVLLDTGRVNIDSKDYYNGLTPLSWAAKKGHEAVVKLLLDTRRVDVNSKDNQGRTPLSWAVENRHEAVVKLLLDTRRADVDSKDDHGRTPLLWAASNRHEAVVKLLLDTGRVNVDSKDNHGRTPLSEATQYRQEVVVKLLRLHGAVS
jgi:ankyrin repeat protein